LCRNTDGCARNNRGDYGGNTNIDNRDSNERTSGDSWGERGYTRIGNGDSNRCADSNRRGKNPDSDIYGGDFQNYRLCNNPIIRKGRRGEGAKA
jgi:hypothetical protein